jgi:hypothetical protein
MLDRYIVSTHTVMMHITDLRRHVYTVYFTARKDQALSAQQGSTLALRLGHTSRRAHRAKKGRLHQKRFTKWSRHTPSPWDSNWVDVAGTTPAGTHKKMGMLRMTSIKGMTSMSYIAGRISMSYIAGMLSMSYIAGKISMSYKAGTISMSYIAEGPPSFKRLPADSPSTQRAIAKAGHT